MVLLYLYLSMYLYLFIVNYVFWLSVCLTSQWELPQALYWPVRMAHMPCACVLRVPNVSCACDTCALFNLKLAGLYCNFTNQRRWKSATIITFFQVVGHIVNLALLNCCYKYYWWKQTSWDPLLGFFNIKINTVLMCENISTISKS